MSYAVRKDGKGWRAISDQSEVGPDETFSETEPADPTTSTVEVIAGYARAIQKRLDDFARTSNYDSILSAATYATSAVVKFKAEGQYAVEARDATWDKCYEVLAEVESGTRPMPTLDELLSELPALQWPNS